MTQQPQTISDKALAQIEQLYTLGYIEEAKILEQKYRSQGTLSITSSNIATLDTLTSFITVHPEMLKVKEKVRKAAMIDDPVLITGESGTGKELIAQALHGSRSGRFVSINATSLPTRIRTIWSC